jgi:hypothetical protein
MLQVADLTGLWRRSLLVWPDGRRDTTTQVLWLQGLCAFGDLRQPQPQTDFSQPAAAVRLRDGICGVQALLVRVGEFYIFARDRRCSLNS